MKQHRIIDGVKSQLAGLDHVYSVWLTKRAPFWKVMFDGELLKMTGNDPKDVIMKCDNRDVLDDWYKELKRNKRVKLSIHTREKLSRSEAYELKAKIEAAGGTAVVECALTEYEIEQKRETLKRQLREAERALEAETARLNQLAAEGKRNAPNAMARLDAELRERIERFFSDREEPYCVRPDGLVDVFGDVEVTPDDLFDEDFSFSFGRVYGDFDCSELGVFSLKGAPRHVDGDFDCSWNGFDSLEGAPEFVGGDFIFTNNEDIEFESLEGGPKVVEGSYICSALHLISLEGAPEKVGGDFDCSYNHLENLEGAPKWVGGDFDCTDNDLQSLEGRPKHIGGEFISDFEEDE